MRVVRPLTGTGSASATTGFYRECAFLVTFPLGRYGSKNRPQFLRKWIHSFGALGIPSTEMQGDIKISTIPPPLITYGNAVKSLTLGAGGPPVSLASPRDHLADTVKVYDYLEHRQLG